MLKHATTGLAIAALAGCTAAKAPADPPPLCGGSVGMCDADAIQHYIGRSVTAPLGLELLAASHARVLRWVPPDTAVTMDYSPQRLTVSYDRAMKITRLGCG